MKRKNLLLPYRVKKAGWAILGVGVMLFIAYIINVDWDFSVNTIRSWLGMVPIEVSGGIPGLSSFNAETGLMNTVTAVLILMGSYLVGFSQCKEEDEYTEHLRYRSLTVTMVALMALELVVMFACWGFAYLVTQNILVKMAPLFYVTYFYILLWTERRKNEE